MPIGAPFIHATIIFITLLVGAASAATGAPPDLTGIAALITAGIGVVGFLVTLMRGKKNNQRVEEVAQATSYVKGFEAMMQRMTSEIDDLRSEQSHERTQWAGERERLMETITTHKAELREAIAEAQVTRGELAELRGQIRGFLTNDQYEQFIKQHSETS